MKTCARCLSEFPEIEFRVLKGTGRADRRDSYCKECRRVLARLDYERNREKRQAANRASYAAHREQRQEYNRRYREEHADELAAHRKKRVKESTYASWRRRLKRLGLTPRDYLALVEKQKNRCAICKTEETGRGGMWAVDHCHTTGRVRGLLCHRCNLAIGQFQDNPQLLRRAAAYLSK
jgi:hypothetical protein